MAACNRKLHQHYELSCFHMHCSPGAPASSSSPASCRMVRLLGVFDGWCLLMAAGA